MKRKSFVIAITLAVVILIGMFILDNNPITNKKFCLSENDCKAYQIGNCCDFIPINDFHNQMAHKYEITCDTICPEYELKCIDFRCELENKNVPSPEIGPA